MYMSESYVITEMLSLSQHPFIVGVWPNRLFCFGNKNPVPILAVNDLRCLPGNHVLGINRPCKSLS